VKFIANDGDVYGSKAVLYFKSSYFKATHSCGDEKMVVEEKNYTCEQLISWMRFSHKSIVGDPSNYTYGGINSWTTKNLAARIELYMKYDQPVELQELFSYIKENPRILSHNMEIYKLLHTTKLCDEIRTTCRNYALYNMEPILYSAIPEKQKDHMTMKARADRMVRKRKAPDATQMGEILRQKLQAEQRAARPIDIMAEQRAARPVEQRAARPVVQRAARPVAQRK
jgi:hypothetical protein